MSEGRMGGVKGLGYVPAIDGLRAVAVLAVLFFHLDEALLPGGYVGVDVFFVISGFVVTASVVDLAPARPLDVFLSFYARRALRILPALVVCIGVTALVYVLVVPKAWLSEATEIVGLAALFGLGNMALILKEDDYFSPRSGFNPFTHTWSLGVEEQFYVIFPLVMLAFFAFAGRRRPGLVLAAFAALSVLSFAASGVLSAVNWRWGFYSLPSRFWELGAGVILMLTIAVWRPRLAAAPRVVARLLAGLAVLILLTALATAPGRHFPFPLATLPVAASLILIALVVARPSDGPARGLAAAPVVGVGRLSYSLYLWHWPVFVFFRWTVGLDGVAPALAALALAFGSAFLSYRCVETPFRSNGGLRGRPRPLIIGAAFAAVVAALFGVQGVFAARPALSLTATASEDVWYPTEDRPGDPDDCAVERRVEPFETGTVTRIAPTSCPSGRAAAGRLVVWGDSHATAYRRMLDYYARRSGHTVEIYFKSGCPYLNFLAPNRTYPACTGFIAAVEARLGATLGRGDVVFLPSLRTPRWRNVSMVGGGYALEGDAARGARNPAAVVAEAAAALAVLERRGAKIVVEAPKPVFRAPPFRCVDWFNEDNPDCAAGLSVSRADIERLRAPSLERIAAVAAQRPSITVWDPLPLLCRDGQCRALSGDRPLFFDGDHVSAYGNDLLYPSFETMIERRFAEAGPPA